MASACSNVSTGEMVTTLGVLVLVYLGLGLIALRIALQEARHGPESLDEKPPTDERPDLALTY